MLLAVLNTSLSAQPQPSGKNKAGAKIGSSKLQIFFLQMSGTAQGRPPGPTSSNSKFNKRSLQSSKVNLQRALVCIKAENYIISRHVFKVQIMGQAMIYNRSIEGSGSLPQYKAEGTTMLKDMDFGVYGKGIDGYIHYSLAMDRIQEEEESRKALMDEFDNDVDEMDELDNDEDNFDSDDLDSDDFGSDDFGGDDF